MGKKITFSSEARKGALRGATQHYLLVATAWGWNKCKSAEEEEGRVGRPVKLSLIHI